MNTVVFDIETVGVDWDSLDDGQRAYLVKNAKTDEERRLVPEWLSLWPMTGKIVVLAMQNVETGRGRVWYEKLDGRVEAKSEDGQFEFVGDTEAAFLEDFWKAMTKFERFVTFNGRGFDCPWMMLRSAILGLKPSKNPWVPLPLRPHVDLRSAHASAPAAGTREIQPRLFCEAFGIASPKEQGMADLVGPPHREGNRGNRTLLPPRWRPPRNSSGSSKRPCCR